MLDWTEGHNTGIAELDRLNRSFYEKLNEFLIANIEARGREHVVELLSFLKDYTQQHVAIQDRYMGHQGYNDRDAHTQAHNEFIQELDRMYGVYEVDGVTSTMVLELQNTMGEWFVHHIGILDRNLGLHVKGGAVLV